MNCKTCFFIGNRHTPNSIKEKLVEAIETHIVEYGVTNFTVGHYGNFDGMVHSVLREAKKQHTDIKLYLLCPYALNQKIDIPESFDGTFYPEGLEKVPLRLVSPQANKYMVQNSNYLITYCHHVGNTRNIVEYAQKLEKNGLIKITLL